VVEEPELFLHPHAQRHVASLLRSIAEEKNSQVILTTHSSAALVNADVLDVIRIDRGNNGGTRCLRLPKDYSELEKLQRILTSETCEMLFADRVVLVEGPSEAICLPRISRILCAGADAGKYSFDRRNISIINVGGKEHLKAYSKLLDDFRIEWRIITDRDALRGNTLDSYKEKAGLAGSENDDQQIDKLRDYGVAVLRKGEIEDYYPHEALAAIKGCTVGEVPKEIEKHRQDWDEPSLFTLIETIFSNNRKEITEVEGPRFRKILKRCYDNALEQLRENGTFTKQSRKTGNTIANWLKLPKPIIALRVSQWMEENPEKVPDSLQRLTKWLFEGMI
jgi:energy-coupling factor transporter ATP-binding protein EcfA2